MEKTGSNMRRVVTNDIRQRILFKLNMSSVLDYHMEWIGLSSRIANVLRILDPNSLEIGKHQIDRPLRCWRYNRPYL